MKIKSGYIMRKFQNNYVVVPTGQATVDFNGMITLNETGAFVGTAGRGKEFRRVGGKFYKRI